MSTELKFDVLHKGFVRLDAFMADDLSVVNSARVSYGKRHDEMEEGDDKLINFLMKHRHGTPFEHNAFRFHVKAPIFVFREWMRHRIGSFNEWSARYVKLEPDFYIPSCENVRRRAEGSKPGQYQTEMVEREEAALFRMVVSDTYQAAWETYSMMMDRGIAPELARIVLPVGIFSQMYWTVNARSLMNFISLRNSPQAQYEIRRYAEAIDYVFMCKMPEVHKAFHANGEVAP